MFYIQFKHMLNYVQNTGRFKCMLKLGVCILGCKLEFSITVINSIPFLQVFIHVKSHGFSGIIEVPSVNTEVYLYKIRTLLICNIDLHDQFMFQQHFKNITYNFPKASCVNVCLICMHSYCGYVFKYLFSCITDNMCKQIPAFHEQPHKSGIITSHAIARVTLK